MTTGTLQAQTCQTGGFTLSELLPMSWRLRETFWKRRLERAVSDPASPRPDWETLSDQRAALQVNQPPM